MIRSYLIAIAAMAVAGPAGALPSAVEAAAQSETEVRVFWTAGSAGSVEILRDGAVIGTVNESAGQFLDARAAPATTYRYEVRRAGAASSPCRPYVERTRAVLPARRRCDVLVVGATTAGVSAAVVAARYGLDVTLIEETRRLGGMSVNGLGASDIRSVEHSSGFFEEFRHRVQEIYGDTTGAGLKYEPRVAHQAMKELIWAEDRLEVHREVRPVAVGMRNGTIASVTAESVRTGQRCIFEPRIVVDATECGDVAAWSGARYRVGREPRSAREPHAGVIYYDRGSASRLPGSTGAGDRRLQAYSYLMTVKDFGPGADKTITRPEGYDPAKYDHAPKWQVSWATSSGTLPNRKFEINQHPHGGDLQGTNYAYPDATYAERRRIEAGFRAHALGYLYYIQTVEGRRNIGLSEDDYRDTGGWPQGLYVREARRFQASVRVDETDILNARKLVRPDAIGVGDYAMDSHAVRPKTNWDDDDMGEGEFYLPQLTPWHQIPFRIMTPTGVDNLLTPTAISATHVAYGTYRMEPVRMHFGAAAGVAAVVCIRHGATTHSAPRGLIQAELLKVLGPEPGLPARLGAGSPGGLREPCLTYMFTDLDRGAIWYAPVMWMAARGAWPCPAPAKTTAKSGLEAAPLKPREVATVFEAVRLLDWLRDRLVREPFTGWSAAADTPPYPDLPAGSALGEAARALRHWRIDPRLFDALAPGDGSGALLFQADRPVTTAEMARAIRLAAAGLGPVWSDWVIDEAPAIPVAAP
ncbi:MAG: FAD-dependent oxidoreductase [Armatimonadetes bacterium]|nr:FAD-dependent oxidoreductase [Armatimonadota bacterium]